MPRTPVNPRTNGHCHGGDGSRRAIAGTDHRAGDQQFFGAVAADTRYHYPRLQSGEQEHQALDHVDEEVPEEDTLQPGTGTDQAKPIPADVKPRSYRGQHTGSAQMLGRPIRQVRRQHRQHDLDARVGHPTAQSQHQSADRESPDQLAGDDCQERADCMTDREQLAANGSDGEAVEDQGRGVVRQAFPFQDDAEATRQVQAARDCQRRDRIRRRNDRSQYESNLP
jgi:hypothetical protein